MLGLKGAGREPARAFHPCGPVMSFAFGVLVKMAPTVAAPYLDGRGDPPANCAEKVELRSRVTNLDVTKSAPALVLQMGPVARDVCVAAGSEQLSDLDGATKIAQSLHDHFASFRCCISGGGALFAH